VKTKKKSQGISGFENQEHLLLLQKVVILAYKEALESEDSSKWMIPVTKKWTLFRRIRRGIS